MKKKILFIISNMESGGVSKSMSSLLNLIDANRYEVDCFVLSPTGIFMPSIPDTVTVIQDRRTSLLCGSFPKNIPALIKEGYVWDALVRMVVGALMLLNKGWGGWLLSRRIFRIPKKYDLAVDYNGQHQLYYLIDYVKAKKKVTFFHSDYEKWPYYYGMDKKYMPKADAIFTISNQCVQSLRHFFPNCANRIGLFENISSTVLIRKLAQENVEDPLGFDGEKLITIGHLSQNKGTDLAIDAAKILKEKGIGFRWYFIGQNQNTEWLTKMVERNGVQDEIVFMGLRANPYPYMQQANILVHPSKFEGKSIALDEAKILCKPIVVTDFSTVTDQFTNRVNASICTMTPEDLADTIEELLSNDALRKSYEHYLADHIHDNSSEIEKLYRLID